LIIVLVIVLPFVRREKQTGRLLHLEEQHESIHRPARPSV